MESLTASLKLSSICSPSFFYLTAVLVSLVVCSVVKDKRKDYTTSLTQEPHALKPSWWLRAVSAPLLCTCWKIVFLNYSPPLHLLAPVSWRSPPPSSALNHYAPSKPPFHFLCKYTLQVPYKYDNVKPSALTYVGQNSASNSWNWKQNKNIGTEMLVFLKSCIGTETSTGT